MASSQALTTANYNDLRSGSAVTRPRIAIIGGGFSGATFATLLMRDPALMPCDITVAEPRDVLGAGIAYSAADPLHRVNIAADRMAALPDAVEDFYVWLKRAQRLDGDPAAVYPDRGIFPARALFGSYVDDLVRRTAAATQHVSFRHAATKVQAATKSGNSYRLQCASGDSIEADILILAIGHPVPRLPWPLSELPPHDGLIVNPWLAGAADRIKPTARVLLVGTGLTMGDMVATLRRQGHQSPLTAMSRHGLTPRPRSGAVDPIQGLSFAADSVSQVLHAIRQEIRKANAATRPWSDVFDAVRLQNGAIWAAWSQPQRRRFQRHLRPYWDVHRFQAAPQIHDLVTQEQAAGNLTIFAAAMTKAALRDEGIDVTLRRRGQDSTETQSFDAIINCTGATGPLVDENPVLKSLASGGLIEPDFFGSGIHVDALSRAKTQAGTFDDSLYVLGPAIRGCLGEISGALEIATHTQTVANAVASLLKERQAITS